MKNKNGFTLLEVITVIIIASILAVTSAAIYKGYKNRAIEAEAQMMLGKLNEAQQTYYARHGDFLDDRSEKSENNSLGVDFRKNKYFTSFHVVSVE